MTGMNKKRTGISAVIAVLLLIAIVVAIGIFVYVWTSGLAGVLTSGNGGTQVAERLLIEVAQADSRSNKIDLYIRNLGSSTIKLDKIFVSSASGIEAFPKWRFMRPITIKENSGSDLKGYQLKIILNSSNFDFTKAKSDGSDIRFYYSNGTEIPYYIEKWDSINKEAVIWIKISINAYSKETIYMYYGNPSAKSESDVDYVFIKNQIYLISTKWPDNVAGSYADNHQEFDEAIASNPTLYGTGYVDKVDYTNNPYGPDDDFMLRFKFLFKATKTGIYYFGTVSDDASEIIWNDEDQDVRHYVIASWYGGHSASGTYADHSGSLSLSAGQAIWIEYRMQEYTGGQKAAMGIKPPGGSWMTVSTSNFPDQLYTRKYVDPEPSINIGDEKQVTLGSVSPGTTIHVVLRMNIVSGRVYTVKIVTKEGTIVVYNVRAH